MKKDCWAVLKIPATKDIATIKKAYRDLIKKYHPDTVQTPEKIRWYTIKCAEIIQAYKEAIEYAETQTHQHETETVIRTEQTVKTPQPRKRPHFVIRVFGNLFLILIGIMPIFLVIELFNIYPAFSRIINFTFTCYESMSVESTFKTIVSFPLALIFGALYGVGISIFSTIPFLFFYSIISPFLSNTKFYEKNMYKVGTLIFVGLNIYITYFVTGVHWPFEHRINAYYNFLYHLCRFLACSLGAIFILSIWGMNYLKYLRVKGSLNLNELILYEKD